MGARAVIHRESVCAGMNDQEPVTGDSSRGLGHHYKYLL